MAIPRRTQSIRLTPELNAKLDKLCATLPSLPRSQVLRLLLESALIGSLQDQVERVTKQLVKTDATDRPEATRNRMNTRY